MTAVIERAEPEDKLASLLDANSEKLLTCVHCGLCLQACPTYRVLGNENDSPRGRIYLMRGLAEGKLSLGNSFTRHIDLCLGCRACETACPSGVPYGQLLEASRVEIARARAKDRPLSTAPEKFILTQVFTRPRLLGALMWVARVLRNSGLARLAFDTKLVGGRARFALALLLASRSPLYRRAGGQATLGAAKASGSNLRVALLRGCVMEGLFAEANRATERVMTHYGCEVVEAEGQACCGALHAHAGEIESAKELARRNIEAFSANASDRIIVNSAGCGAAMKEYDRLLADDPEYAAKARQFSKKVRDLFEFLVEMGLEPPGSSVRRRIAYDAPCHLIHAQRIISAPIDVLKLIPGVTLTPLEGYESCCAGAGIYNMQHPELSQEILTKKMRCIAESGADTVATPNPVCIMQIGAGALLAGLGIEVIHPIELLDAACGVGDAGLK
jgi:glycolate oxidase iron-sulfur subunit